MYRRLAFFFILLLLFTIPFFWLSPGEIDLGGDSSRLYFYDPIAYLKSFPLYSIGPTGTGVEIGSYSLIPFVVTLFIAKSIVGSSHLLITLFNSFALISGFMSIYWIIRELVMDTNVLKKNEGVISGVGIVSGLFYVFSPMLTPNGWDKAMYAHNVFFLNPLFFLLLLKYINTKKIHFALLAILISFIFAPNFSPAPSLFSFFPIALLYLAMYLRFVKKATVKLREILLVITAFIFIHSFHLVTLLLLVFKPSSYINVGVFSSTGKFVRGLDYFLNTAKSTLLTKNLMGLPQGESIAVLHFFWATFPMILIIGCILNIQKNIPKEKKINFLLLYSFFLILIFLMTANITHIGFVFYTLLFRIPGFSMFRNYAGQFSHVFIFFYTLLFGYSLYYSFLYLGSMRKMAALMSFFLVLIILTAYPFIKGDMVNLVLNQDSKTSVKVPIIMDPEYAKALKYIQKVPFDAKFLSFPLTDAGLQMVSGEKGGAYQGPSTIAYLTGKNDFAGYGGLNPYGDFFLQLVRDKDIEGLDNLLSLLNIRYIFYNSDTYIYDDVFPGFPYSHVREFMPKDQKGYKEFLQLLPIQKKKDFGNKYHIYEVLKNKFLPHIYTPTQLVSTNNSFTFPLISKINNNVRAAVVNINDSLYQSDTYIYAQDKNSFSSLRDNYHLHPHVPYISQNVNSILYPFVVWKETYDIEKKKKDPDSYRDANLLNASKRISEISLWQGELTILRHEWQEPKIWQLYKTDLYFSWESELTRYKESMKKLILWNEFTAISDTKKRTNKIIIFEQLQQHQRKLVKLIKNNSTMVGKDKLYLRKLTQNTFETLMDILNLPILNASLTYALSIPEKYKGDYEIYAGSNELSAGQLQQSVITISDKKIRSTGNSSQRFTEFEKAHIEPNKEYSISFNYPLDNLVKDQSWINHGDATEEKNEEKNTQTFTVNNILSNNSAGLLKNISHWKPQRQYLITFDYLTYGDDFIYKLYDKKFIDGRLSSIDLLFEKILNSKSWKTQQTILTSDRLSEEAFIHILSDTEKTDPKISFRNISVVELPSVEIIFKRISNSKSFIISPPKITFAKINPTKYKISVQEANGPYPIVFSESFDPSWKVYALDNNSREDVTNKVVWTIGRIFKKITQIFLRENSNASIVDSYFNDTIREVKQSNIFFGPSVFETWGKNSIANNHHYQTNGYANLWIISPEDVGQKKDYNLVIEHSTQKTFYVLFGISLTAAASVILALAYLLFKKFSGYRKSL